MKNRKFIVYSVILIVFFLLVYYQVDKNNDSYSINIISYTNNESYVEYPQVNDLKDIKKQDDINNLLEDQVFHGAKDYMNKSFVDFSIPGCEYHYTCGAGFSNRYISSFWYSFNAYDKNGSGVFGFMGYIDRFFCITIDMNTGKKIELSDFMVVDERLINSNDGTMIETNYNSAANPIFHNFKDAFMVYTSEQEKDEYHLFTPQEIIDRLIDTQGETNWYIDENKNIVFCSGKNFVEIPYNEFADVIYPKYLDMLKN